MRPGAEGGERESGGAGTARLRLVIRGAVQGVGFRPAVYRLATSLELAGWVVNDTRGVILEVEGPAARVAAFRARLLAAPPPNARVDEVVEAPLAPAGETGFEIRDSDEGGERSVLMLPDLAPCPACLAEVRDPAARRHGYAFTNCTECGPRFTIVRALPYDRPNTTMAGFPLCPDCRSEYEDPLDRRFHAQPIACPACGPQLALWDAGGATLATGDEALARAAAAIAAGRVVAVKGLGGFQLVCDAANEAVVASLRTSKARLSKPFALMARDLAQARALCEVDAAAARALASAAAPILLLPRRADAPVAAGVAPGLPTLGVMLPATPLHHLLLAALPGAVVCTSGNRADEPIAIDEREARSRLAGMADLYLVHDRPIERHCDDSVGWVVDGAPAWLRRARGVAPLPVQLDAPGPVVLAVGPHLKNTVALAAGAHVFVSQHVGDLETAPALAAFERVIADLERLRGVSAEAIAHDLHPDYLSTRWASAAAAARGVPLVGVQHHHAHLAACLAEHGGPGRALGVVWDGTGYGTDGTIWGGEFLLGDAAGVARVAHLASLRLPGGDAAIREPRRSSLAALYATLGSAAFAHPLVTAAFRAEELAVLARMLERGVGAPETTSAGRVFDALAALLGLHPHAGHEGQAAMALEALAHGVAPAPGAALALPLAEAGGALVLDWRPLVAAALEWRARGDDPRAIAARAHDALVAAIAAVAARVGEPRVALSGGCFQNRRLLEGAAAALRAAGHEVLMHRELPPNDGGVSVGQAVVARAVLAAGG